MFETVSKGSTRGAVAVAALVVGFTFASVPAAVALPQFTWNPNAVGLNGTGSFIADNLVVSDFSKVVLTPFMSGANFTDQGTLAVSALQLNGGPVNTTGLNTVGGFGLYFTFAATGFQTTPTFTNGTTGTFQTLSFSMFGHNYTGPITYLPDDVTPTGVTGEILLATGSLIGGSVGSTPDPLTGLAVPNAQAAITFAPTAAGLLFFVAPDPFYNVALAAFTNTLSQVTPTSDGFEITAGGGAVNFLQTPVPEPASLALLGAGLVSFGLVRSRRRRGTA